MLSVILGIRGHGKESIGKESMALSATKPTLCGSASKHCKIANFVPFGCARTYVKINAPKVPIIEFLAEEAEHAPPSAMLSPYQWILSDLCRDPCLAAESSGYEPGAPELADEQAVGFFRRQDAVVQCRRRAWKGGVVERMR